MGFVYEKFTGTGNDFLIVDIRGRSADFDAQTQGLSRSQWAQKLCNRNFGLGADGLVLLDTAQQGHLKWDFYNSDGSEAEMCGNAARCVGRWARIHLPAWESLQLETKAGNIHIQKASDDEFSIQMSPIHQAQFDQRLKIQDRDVVYHFVDSGVPHVVIQRESLDLIQSEKELARRLRSHAQFHPRGSNVTFYQKISDTHIRCISFERGVEDFTLSCGTGAVAAAYVHYKQSKHGVVNVDVPGGRLQVKFLPSAPILTGPAIKIADCTLSS